MPGWIGQAGIKIAGRNINNLRYVDDTTLMAESKEELKSILIKVKKDSKKKAGLSARFGSTYTKIGMIQRRLAWPLCKDDMQIREAFHIFLSKKRKSWLKTQHSEN